MAEQKKFNIFKKSLDALIKPDTDHLSNYVRAMFDPNNKIETQIFDQSKRPATQLSNPEHGEPLTVDGIPKSMFGMFQHEKDDAGMDQEIKRSKLEVSKAQRERAALEQELKAVNEELHLLESEYEALSIKLGSTSTVGQMLASNEDDTSKQK